MFDGLPVIAGVDGSASSLEAALLAAGEAVARSVPLVLLHVGAPEPRVFERALARLRPQFPTLAVSSRHALTGRPSTAEVAAALTDAATDADLLVIGHRGQSGRGPAGSVAQLVAGVAKVATIVHRATDPACAGVEPARVLAGVSPDGSPDDVLEFGLLEAERHRARLDVICAWPDVRSAQVEDRPPPVADAVHRWFGKYPDVETHLHVRAGIDPAIALMVDSHVARLVVVGAGTRAARAASSSIAHALVHRAGCPVAIVPPPAEVPASA